MAKGVPRSGTVRATIFNCECVECRDLVSDSATKELDTDRDEAINNLGYGLRDHVTVSEDRDTEKTSVPQSTDESAELRVRAMYNKGRTNDDVILHTTMLF